MKTTPELSPEEQAKVDKVKGITSIICISVILTIYAFTHGWLDPLLGNKDPYTPEEHEFFKKARNDFWKDPTLTFEERKQRTLDELNGKKDSSSSNR